jgi:histidinol-phosphate aminotransferase
MTTPKPYIADITPYQPGMPIELVARERGIDPKDIIKLASNENPLGTSPHVVHAIDAAAKAGHRYPEQYGLIKALADHHKVDQTAIVVGNGSNDVLDLIARAYLGKGDDAVSSQYAFAVYQLATQSVGARNTIMPAAAHGHDLPAMLRAITPDTKVLWIANPNNPTGTFIPYPVLKQLLSQVRRDITIVLDEAYYEYLAPEERANTVEWLADLPDLILVRTFSKIHGLAGLRIGYAIASPATAELLNRVRQPFNVNNLAIVAATAALKDHAFVAKSYEMNRAGRKQLQQGLAALGLECLPAHANFVTVRVKNAGHVYEHLLQEGIIVRPLGAYGMPDWLRVTVGLPHENQRFLAALTTAIK